MNNSVLLGILKPYYFYLSKNSTFYRKFFKLLGFYPRNINLYKQAFLHNSKSKKIDGIKTKTNNERLEYLGDAVLDLIIAELLYKKFPFQGEGFLTDMRSKSASRNMLSKIATSMGIGDFIEIDKSIEKNQSAVRSIAGNALEALIGAIYVDKGYHFTKKYVKRKIVKPFLDFDELKDITVNFKSLLNQYAQKNKKHLEFKILNDNGEKRIRTYIIGVMIDGEEIARGRGKSKKVAEQIASEKSCELLKLSKNYKS